MLVPASSAVAVATTSAGAAWAQARRVIALRSGEENTAASSRREHEHDHQRDHELLDQVVGPGREQVRVRGAVPRRAARLRRRHRTAPRSRPVTGGGGRQRHRTDDSAAHRPPGRRPARAGSGGTASNGGTPRAGGPGHVRDDQHADDQRQQHDVPQQHLARVEHVEVGADADRVQPVLGLGGDPLRVEVGLRQVAGERGADRADEARPRR